MEQYAYVRVSTKEQNIDRQLMAIEPFDVKRANIYCDYLSGKNFDRPEYQKMVKKLKEGDLLIVKSIDRLGRNYEEIIAQWQHITKDIKADILVLDMELLDTRKKANNLTGVLIADLVLQIFAYVAQTEREFIKQRQAEGILAAKSKGVKFGRKEVELSEDFVAVCEKCRRGEMTCAEAIHTLKMSRSTFYRKYKMFIKNVPESRLFETV